MSWGLTICLVLGAAWVLGSLAVGLYVIMAPRRGGVSDGLWGEGERDLSPSGMRAYGDRHHAA